MINLPHHQKIAVIDSLSVLVLIERSGSGGEGVGTNLQTKTLSAQPLAALHYITPCAGPHDVILPLMPPNCLLHLKKRCFCLKYCKMSSVCHQFSGIKSKPEKKYTCIKNYISSLVVFFKANATYFNLKRFLINTRQNHCKPT